MPIGRMEEHWIKEKQDWAMHLTARDGLLTAVALQGDLQGAVGCRREKAGHAVMEPVLPETSGEKHVSSGGLVA